MKKENPKEKMASRKFILASVSLVLAQINLMLKLISDEMWLAGITLAMGVYGAANVIQKMKLK